MTRRRLGVIARADDGGLGNQTRDLCAHLDPDVHLVVMMGEGARGTERPDRFPEYPRSVFNPGPRIFDEHLDDVLSRVDVLYTVEGPYHPELFEACERFGVELVIHANPELYKRYLCHRLLVPTSWRLDQMPDTVEVLPFPVDVARLSPSPGEEVPTFVHLTGPAMLDRQGTALVMGALAHIVHECRLIIRHDGGYAADKVGNVVVEWIPRSDDYWDAIPGGCWAMIQPRRYGGLSLCIQEAAAKGIPTIALAREPETTFYADVTWPIPVTFEEPYPMAGGEVMVAESSSVAVAGAVNEFIESMLSDPGRMGAEMLRCRAWAVAHSWEALRPDYEKVLR